MSNPWEEIPLSEYESHMGLDSVGQLQALNEMTRLQLDSFPAETAMILGVAGGNGMEHADIEKYRKVFGVDVNADYLRIAKERCARLGDVAEFIRMDVRRETEPLPRAQLLIANLVIEYIGHQAFRSVVTRTEPEYVSCVIQLSGDNGWVSDSPWLHAFDALEELHQEIEEETLKTNLREIGCALVSRSDVPLPGGKRLARLDFVRHDSRPTGIG